MDHLYQIGGPGTKDQEMLEGWSVLNALARETKKVRLGTLVTGVTYRNPAMLAKMATTLDVVSGGRAIFGLGAAWNDEEHDAFGYDFPPVKERMDRLDEALTIARAMFRGERPTFDGQLLPRSTRSSTCLCRCSRAAPGSWSVAVESSAPCASPPATPT